MKCIAEYWHMVIKGSSDYITVVIIFFSEQHECTCDSCRQLRTWWPDMPRAIVNGTVFPWSTLHLFAQRRCTTLFSVSPVGVAQVRLQRSCRFPKEIIFARGWECPLQNLAGWLECLSPGSLAVEIITYPLTVLSMRTKFQRHATCLP